MTRTELENRLQKLENAKFILAMKDLWNHSDWEEDNRLDKEIAETKKALAIA